jgi:hypothetical protein
MVLMYYEEGEHTIKENVVIFGVDSEEIGLV